MRCSLFGLALLAASASARTINIEAGDDFEASCLHVVEAGDTCYLAKGDYEHDGLTVTHGTADKRITITGDPEACIRGSNTQDRVLQIAHDYYTIDGICFNGQHGSDYVATAIYVLGEDKKSTKNGVTSSVTGLQMFNLEIKNFNSECVHFRYFVTHAEVSGCSISYCGVEDFEDGGGGKVGEGIYVGTALDQVDDNKAPEIKLRSGSADNVDADVCAYNWIHHNTFRTHGNECVDVKEGSAFNLIENNICEHQRDENSGGFGFRGSDNTGRYNEIAECVGSGFRVGGDNDHGQGNNMYGNNIKNCKAAFNVMSENQGVVCENEVSGVDHTSIGAFDHNQDQFLIENATGSCSSKPGDLDWADSSSADSGGDSAAGDDYSEAEDEDSQANVEDSQADVEDSQVDDEDSQADDEDSPAEGLSAVDDDSGIDAGANFADDDATTEPEITPIETNENAGSTGLGECASVLKVHSARVEHPHFEDADNSIENLFDGDLDTYYSVNRADTVFTFELEEETECDGVAIDFFMKSAEEERIQTFSIATRGEDDDDEWETVISRKESSGSMDIQTFPFSSRKALYVRIETFGNSYNNWSALTEVEFCSAAEGEESNALFGGMKAVGEELEVLAGEVCAAPDKLTPTKVHESGGSNVAAVFDGNSQTRWSTENTQHDSDLDNDKITITLEGDTRISSVDITFFDADLATQYFSIYKQSAKASTWTPVMQGAAAEKHNGVQSFDINSDSITTLYIVGNGNSIGDFSKFSEIVVNGC